MRNTNQNTLSSNDVLKVNAIHESEDGKFCFVEFHKEQSKKNHLLSRDAFINRYGDELIKRFKNDIM